jgi:nicotinate-nucleotide adenylyltransferase
MRSLALVDGRGLSDLETAKPSLLHARAASVLLRDRYGVKDDSVLEAVRLHISGESGMGPLSKIIYIADKLEPSRAEVDPALRELARTADLDSLFGAVLNRTAAFLRSQGKSIAEGTLRLLSGGEEV